MIMSSVSFDEFGYSLFMLKKGSISSAPPALKYRFEFIQRVTMLALSLSLGNGFVLVLLTNGITWHIWHKPVLWSLRNWLFWIKPCNFPADSNSECCHFIARNSPRRYWSRCPPRCWLEAPHLCASVGKMLELCVAIWVAWRNPHIPQPRRKDHWTWWGEWDGDVWLGNLFVYSLKYM